MNNVTTLDHICSKHVALLEFQHARMWNRQQERGLFDALGMWAAA